MENELKPSLFDLERCLELGHVDVELQEVAVEGVARIVEKVIRLPFELLHNLDEGLDQVVHPLDLVVSFKRRALENARENVSIRERHGEHWRR
eukprot:2793227-Rhodomonas_salina.7